MICVMIHLVYLSAFNERNLIFRQTCFYDII